MAYCTQTDILELMSSADLVDVTDDADAGTVDTDAVDRAIADADAEIDGFCGERYPVPFTTVPDIIRKMAVDMAIYNLYARRRGAPEDRKIRYDAAIDRLTAVAAGTFSLGADDPDGVPSEGNAPTISSSTRIFSRSKMTGF